MRWTRTGDCQPFSGRVSASWKVLEERRKGGLAQECYAEVTGTEMKALYLPIHLWFSEQLLCAMPQSITRHITCQDPMVSRVGMWPGLMGAWLCHHNVNCAGLYLVTISLQTILNFKSQRICVGCSRKIGNFWKSKKKKKKKRPFPITTTHILLCLLPTVLSKFLSVHPFICMKLLDFGKVFHLET